MTDCSGAGRHDPWGDDITLNLVATFNFSVAGDANCHWVRRLGVPDLDLSDLEQTPKTWKTLRRQPT
jgi:hypothetical protein